MAECKICGVTDRERVEQGRAKLGIDRLCDGCWEVTTRLERFIMLPKGRAYVEELLFGDKDSGGNNGLYHNTDSEQRPDTQAADGGRPGGQDP